MVRLVSLLLFPFLVQASNVGSKLTIEVTDSTLSDGCFKSGCGTPLLELRLAHAHSRLSVGWPIAVPLLRLEARPQPWPLILPAALGNLSALISGTDAKYGFPRVCDTSPLTPLLLAPGEKRHYTLDGECFNLTISVRRADCCPTCELASGCCSRNAIAGDDGAVPVLASVGLETRVPLWVALATGALCLLLLGVSLVLLTLCARGRRKKLPTYGSGSSQSKTKICRSLSQESKYEVPWDQKFRPLPDYVRQLNSAHTSDRSSEGCD